MSNETYRMAKQAINDARSNKKSRCLMFVKPSNQGKTHTAQIIARDLNATIIPVMSINEQRTWFSQRLDNPIFILDDPSDWFVYVDRVHVFSIIKNLISGWLKSGRATKFDFNVPSPVDKKCCIIMFCNEEQYNQVRQELALTGLNARTELYLTRHTEATVEKILSDYETYGYNSRKLPKFRDDENMDFDNKFLKSGKDKTYFPEDISFEHWVKSKGGERSERN